MYLVCSRKSLVLQFLSPLFSSIGSFARGVGSFVSCARLGSTNNFRLSGLGIQHSTEQQKLIQDPKRTHPEDSHLQGSCGCSHIYPRLPWASSSGDGGTNKETAFGKGVCNRSHVCHLFLISIPFFFF